jgi:hypothetical protein
VVPPAPPMIPSADVPAGTNNTPLFRIGPKKVAFNPRRGCAGYLSVTNLTGVPVAARLFFPAWTAGSGAQRHRPNRWGRLLRGPGHGALFGPGDHAEDARPGQRSAASTPHPGMGVTPLLGLRGTLVVTGTRFLPWRRTPVADTPGSPLHRLEERLERGVVRMRQGRRPACRGGGVQSPSISSRRPPAAEMTLRKPIPARDFCRKSHFTGRATLKRSGAGKTAVRGGRTRSGGTASAGRYGGRSQS